MAILTRVFPASTTIDFLLLMMLLLEPIFMQILQLWGILLSSENKLSIGLPAVESAAALRDTRPCVSKGLI
jgi:hypothetical protein